MTVEKLKQFCKERGIFVPSKATKEYLHAAIVRAFYHKQKPKNMKTCFGFWEYEDSSCGVCDFQDKCSKASLGMDRNEYFKALESAENPKLRFKKSMRTIR